MIQGNHEIKFMKQNAIGRSAITSNRYQPLARQSFAYMTLQLAASRLHGKSHFWRGVFFLGGEGGGGGCGNKFSHIN